MKIQKKILLSGASGFVGQGLSAFLKASGFQVFQLVRRRAKSPEEIPWTIDGGLEDPSKIEAINGVIHLSGQNILTRWSEKKKAILRNSRIESTKTLVKVLNGLSRPPESFLCASATGYYGYHREGELDEDSSRGEGFLAGLCSHWEEEAEKAQGFRSVFLRFGIILGPQGGALKSMLLPFRLCLGGSIGRGSQCMSWISLPDTLRAILHCLETPSIQGPVNVVAPHGVTNLEFTKTLGKVLKRPTLFPVPTWVIHLLFGQMGRETLLSDLKVRPKKLEETSFKFIHPYLEETLKELIPW